MLRFFSVAEADGLIYPRPSGENFSFACLRSCLPYQVWELSPNVPLGYQSGSTLSGCSFVTYGHPDFLRQVTLPPFGMMCSNNQLTSAHPFLSLFIFFCHHHHMKCFLFSDLRIFSLYIYTFLGQPIIARKGKPVDRMINRCSYEQSRTHRFINKVVTGCHYVLFT